MAKQSRCPDAALEVAWHAEGDVGFVVVAGDVDMDNADQLSSVLADTVGAGVRHLVIDLGGVAFFGSAGVQALAEHHVLTVGSGCRVELRGLPAIVRRILEISGVLEWFEVTESPADRSQDA